MIKNNFIKNVFTGLEKSITFEPIINKSKVAFELLEKEKIRDKDKEKEKEKEKLCDYCMSKKNAIQRISKEKDPNCKCIKSKSLSEWGRKTPIDVKSVTLEAEKNKALLKENLKNNQDKNELKKYNFFNYFILVC